MRFSSQIFSISIFSTLCLSNFAVAHEAKAKKPNESWQEWHMREEHGIEDFDAASFFTLHDLDGSKTWTRNDILNLYGLLNDQFVGDGDGMGNHENTQKISQETKDMVLRTVLTLVDTDRDDVISEKEWQDFTKAGNVLPDFGLGAGHHGDYEYEYEVHHWLKYHAENDPDVNIVHQEDIEHERLYHQQEHKDHPDDHPGGIAIKVVEPIAFGAVKEINIPGKFKRV